jgi:site-specific recombinase XerD
LERYLNHRSKLELGQRQRDADRRLLGHMRNAFLGTRSPHQLTEDQILAFFSNLRAKGLGTSVRGQYASVLRQFLRYHSAPSERWVPKIPMAPPQDEGRYLGSDERAQLWAACVTPEDELLLAMGLGNGFRRSDMVRCRLADLTPSWEAARFVTFHGKGEKWHPVRVQLHPKLKEVLVQRFLPWRAARLASASAIRGLPPSEPPTLLFAVSNHLGIKPMGLTTIDRRIHDLYRKARVDDGGWPLHNLRRTWAENRLEAATIEFTREGHNPAMALELAIRVVQREGRWKQAEVLRRYLKRQLLASSTSLAQTAV